MFKFLAILAVSIGILVVLMKLSSIYVLSTNLRCPDCEATPVTRIIDSDTFVSGNTRIRLYGMDTPEIDEKCADEATERLRKLAGDRVRVERGPRSTDRYGRSLVYVYTESGLSIDELLVKEGLAVAWTRDGRHMDYLMELERKTKSEGIGCLWQEGRH